MHEINACALDECDVKCVVEERAPAADEHRQHGHQHSNNLKIKLLYSEHNGHVECAKYNNGYPPGWIHCVVMKSTHLFSALHVVVVQIRFFAFDSTVIW